MSRWKALPAELDPRARQLVIRLRRLKDHSGLSIRQLAAKTGYSPKSWERYLGGRTLPPREAVEALARIAGDGDPTRLLALHEVAAEGWGSPRRQHAEPEPEPDMELLPAGAESPARSGHSLLIALVAGAVTLVLAVSSAVLVTVRIMNENENDSGGSNAPPKPTTLLAASASPSSAPPQPSYTCRLKRVDGLWYAGNSRTREDNVVYGNNGVEVAEAQCLLRRAGFSPGGIDGDFGPLTLGAVRALQKHAGLHVDGMVGPHTWKALRG